MQSKILLTTWGVSVAIASCWLGRGDFLLGFTLIVGAAFLIRFVMSELESDNQGDAFEPFSRITDTFESLSCLDFNDDETLGRYIYEELDLDARSELSEHVILRSVETGALDTMLADRIRQFRDNVIPKIDQRLPTHEILIDREWNALFIESRELHKLLQTKRGITKR